MRPERPFLMVIDPSPETGARVGALLRTAGLDVPVLHADNDAEARRLTADASPLMLYYHAAARERYPLDEASRLAAERHSILVLAPEGDGSEEQVSDPETGAPLPMIDPSGLPEALRQRLGRPHGEEKSGADLAATPELRASSVANDSSDRPTARVYEGLHVAANDAYRRLLGIEDSTELSTVSLLDILQHDERDVKKVVRGLSRGEFPPPEETFRLRTGDGTELLVHLAFEPVRHEGEDCVQVIVCGESRKPAHGDEEPASPTAAAPLETRSPTPTRADVAHGAAAIDAEYTPDAVTMAAADSASRPRAGVSSPEDLDPLTGLLRRGPFIRRLNEQLQNLPADQRAAVYFLANDGATEQLESMTVADMDRYVQATTNEVLSCLEEADVVGRINDACIALFALREDKMALKRLGERLCAGIARQAEGREGEPIPRTCSVGAVFLDPQHHDAEHTLENARAACRVAAEEGNRAIRYKPARFAGVSEDEETQWRERIRYALDNEDFYTVQHSIMNLDGGLEGLVENRTFMHEDEGDLPPDVYLPAAERNQLASQVDRLVIPGLLRAVSSGEDRLIIDISGNSLQDFSFPAWFQRTLQEARVAGQRIVLQWPAWAARQQTKAARRLIEELSPLGVQFSVSGFDPEPKTLEVLKQLKLGYLTLDTELTAELERDSSRLDAIREVVRAAEALQVTTIASDVATPGDLAMLWRGGVKLVSGDFVQEQPRIIGQ